MVTSNHIGLAGAMDGDNLTPHQRASVAIARYIIEDESALPWIPNSRRMPVLPRKEAAMRMERYERWLASLPYARRVVAAAKAARNGICSFDDAMRASL